MTGDYRVTTERMSEGAWHDSAADYLIYLFHVATYDFAMRWCVDAHVLDLGCGTGYGTHQLAGVAKSATGLDIAPDAIADAERRYVAPNLTYKAMLPIEKAPLAFPNASFDVVTSFQVIEHVDSVETYLSEVIRVLRPGGAFLCATPDRTTRLFRRQRPWNLYHRDEFSPKQLAATVGAYFGDVRVMGMTAPADVIEIELKRCRRMRMMCYPVTFPGVPESWRMAGLRLFKRLRRPKAQRALADRPTYPFSVSDIDISEDAHPSTNIVITARHLRSDPDP